MAGTSGKIQGDKNDTTPAKNAVQIVTSTNSDMTSPP